MGKPVQGGGPQWCAGARYNPKIARSFYFVGAAIFAAIHVLPYRWRNRIEGLTYTSIETPNL
jgi:hypothetical protein